MKFKETLTNETLISAVPDKFRLARIAIQLARHHINAGHDFTVTSLLGEMRKHPGYLVQPEEDKAS